MDYSRTSFATARGESAAPRVQPVKEWLGFRTLDAKLTRDGVRLFFPVNVCSTGLIISRAPFMYIYYIYTEKKSLIFVTIIA